MLRTIIFLVLLLYLFEISAQQPTFQWAKVGANSEYSNVLDVEQDLNGDIVVLGEYNNTVTIDLPSINVSIGDSLILGGKGYVAKFSKNGSLIWHKLIEGNSNQNSYVTVVDLKLTSDGSCVIYGSYFGLCDFDPSEAGEHIISAGPEGTMFILKLDHNGNFQWVRTFEFDLSIFASNLSEVVPTEIELDLDDNIYAVGRYLGRLDFDPDTGDTSFAYTGSSLNFDGYLLKLSNGGDFVWKQTYGSSGSNNNDNLTMIKRGLDNDLYFGCTYHDSIHVIISGQVVLLNHPPGFWADDDDFFMAKMDTSGSIEWITRIVGYGSQAITDLEVDVNGEIYACGVFNGSVTLTPFILSSYVYSLVSSPPAPSYPDGFLIKYTSNGDPIWGTVISSLDSDILTEIELDEESIYLAGSTGDSLHVGTDFMGYSELAGDNYFDDKHGAFWKLSKDGLCDWVQRLESNGSSIVRDFLIDNNDIFSVGGFYYDIDFDPNIGDSAYVMSLGDSDGFLHKMIFLEDTIDYSNFSIFPNPTSNFVNLFIDDYQGWKVSIIDLQGRLIDEIILESKLTIVDLISEASGVYFLLLSKEEERKVERVIKE